MKEIIFTSYLRAGGVTLLAKAFMAIIMFAEIYVITAQFGKDNFGEFIYAMTIIAMVGVILANPVKSFILYRLSGDSHPMQSQVIRVMMTYMLIAGLIASTIIYSAGLTFDRIWFYGLAWITLLEMLRISLCAGLQAAQKIPTAVFYNNIVPAIGRGAALIFIYFSTDIDIAWFTIIYIVIFALPVLCMTFFYKARPAICSGFHIHRADIFYIGKLTLTQIVHQHSRLIDFILLGLIGTMMMTADYAVAMKFAALLLIGKQITEGLLTPRMTTIPAFENEYHAARIFSMIIAFSGILFFALCGHYIVPMLGDYGASYHLFFLIGGAMVARVMTGSSSEFLAMRGHTGWILTAGIVSAIGAMICAATAIPHYGAVGAGIAAFIGAALSNIILGIAAWKCERFIVTPLPDFIIAAGIIILCLLAGLHLLMPFYAIIGIGILLIIYVFARHEFISNFIKRIKGY